MAALRAARSDLGAPRQLVRHLLRHADGGEDAGHQPLGVRRPLAEEVDLAVPALAHPTASAARRVSSAVERELLAGRGQHVAAGQHDLDAALAPGRRDDVDRGRLQLDEEEVGVDRPRARRAAPAGRPGCRRRATTSAPYASSRCVRSPSCARSRRGREERDAATLDRLRPGGAGAPSRARSGRAGLPAPAAPPSPFPARPSSARRDPRSGAGTRSGSRSRPLDPAARSRRGSVGSSRRAAGRRRSRRRGRARGRARAPCARPRGTFEAKTAPARPPPQRRQPTVGTPARAAVSR